VLDGDLEKNALDFIKSVQENKLPTTSKKYEYGKYAIKATIKCNSKRICNIYMGKNSFDVQPVAEYTDKFNAYVNDLELKSIIWDNVQKCGRCQNNTCLKQSGQTKETFRGFNKIIFGKEIDNTCKHGNLMFRNPNDNEFDCIQKIVYFNKQCL